MFGRRLQVRQEIVKDLILEVLADQGLDGAPEADALELRLSTQKSLVVTESIFVLSRSNDKNTLFNLGDYCNIVLSS